MCGIVGYIGSKECGNILLDGLKRLEYRGYDSAGIAIFDGSQIQIKRVKGKLKLLEEKFLNEPLHGFVGIGHTRWATHGKPSEENAHPHKYEDVVVVHNGIIENHLELKEELATKGHRFQSETDTEIISHLISENLKNGMDFRGASHSALLRLKGSYAIVAICAKEPEYLLIAKNASPLIIGIGDSGENLVASDIPAILPYTRNIVILEEGEMGFVSRDSFKIWNIETQKEKEKKITHVTWSLTMAEKGGFKHFLLKEIFEQPRALVDTIRGRISIEKGEIQFENINFKKEFINKIRKIFIVACGTSFHAAMVGKHLIEDISKIPVEVELASEFQYRKEAISPSDLFLGISQSGETIDTLMSLKIAKERGAFTFSICNVVDSSIARESENVLYTHAGPEISVASTKAFTTQIVSLYMLSLYLGFLNNSITRDKVKEKLNSLIAIPGIMEELLRKNELYREIAKKYFHYSNMLYLGRGILFPVALEGALKLKEISYIHAEGYAAGEMKHGPIALIDEDFPTFLLIPQSPYYSKSLGNLHEIKSRGGKIIAIITEGDKKVSSLVSDFIEIPCVNYEFFPLVITIPLQLFAYHVADLKGTDIDQPRNLAKSVTVE